MVDINGQLQKRYAMKRLILFAEYFVAPALFLGLYGFLYHSFETWAPKSFRPIPFYIFHLVAAVLYGLYLYLVLIKDRNRPRKLMIPVLACSAVLIFFLTVVCALYFHRWNIDERATFVGITTGAYLAVIFYSLKKSDKN